MLLCYVTYVHAGVELETEGRDRTDLDLPGNQLQILKDAIFYSKISPFVMFQIVLQLPS